MTRLQRLLQELHRPDFEKTRLLQRFLQAFTMARPAEAIALKKCHREDWNFVLDSPRVLPRLRIGSTSSTWQVMRNWRCSRGIPTLATTLAARVCSSRRNSGASTLSWSRTTSPIAAEVEEIGQMEQATGKAATRTTLRGRHEGARGVSHHGFEDGSDNARKVDKCEDDV
jgi:hypothetical protein